MICSKGCDVNVVGKSDVNSLGYRLCFDAYSFIYPFRKMVLRQV